MFAWTAWRPKPMNPMPMRLLGATLPSAPKAEPGTNMGSANPLPKAMAALRMKPRRVTLPALEVVVAGCMVFSLRRCMGFSLYAGFTSPPEVRRRRP